MSKKLYIQLTEEGADADRLARLTGRLRRELLQLDVDDVTALQARDPLPGPRVFHMATVGALTLALESAEGLRSVVSVVRAWLRRGKGTHRTVRLELDSDALELSQASTADQERLI